MTWLRESDRWKHLLGGMALGVFADSTYCAAYVGVGVASALEYKDRAHSGAWDWVDWSLTVAGAAIGYTARFLATGLYCSVL